jgi:diphthamide biosynthesis protein 3
MTQTVPSSTHLKLTSLAKEICAMAENIYDEIEIEDMTYDPALEIYHYPCPCGDKFEISIVDLRDGEEIAVCPSCSLMIRVIFEVVSRSERNTGLETLRISC